VAAHRLPGISGKAVVRALERNGFRVERVSGSHHVLRRPDVPASKVIVPVHGGHDLPPGTLRSILKQAGLSVDEFIASL
jgi:predicted RNA binding protein YcfA (HicA-like mRNA interferase family)